VLSPDDQMIYRPRLDALAQTLGAAGHDPYLQEKLKNYAMQRNAKD
jgi:hypothetical protein